MLNSLTPYPLVFPGMSRKLQVFWNYRGKNGVIFPIQVVRLVLSGKEAQVLLVMLA